RIDMSHTHTHTHTHKHTHILPHTYTYTHIREDKHAFSTSPAQSQSGNPPLALLWGPNQSSSPSPAEKVITKLARRISAQRQMVSGRNTLMSPASIRAVQLVDFSRGVSVCVCVCVCVD